jgi:hypothetical protein
LFEFFTWVILISTMHLLGLKKKIVIFVCFNVMIYIEFELFNY